MGVSTLTLTPPSATFSTRVLTVRPRSTPAHPDSGSMSTAASATGPRQPTGLSARLRLMVGNTHQRRDVLTLCSALETTDGFQCPSNSPTDEFGQFDPHPKYADPNDCANFYVCLNGISPREQGCELGLVFNELTLQCDAPENVPECKDYYAFLDEDEDNKRRK